MALITAELSIAFPDDGGYIIWVQEAFGNFLAFQEGYWAWLSGVVDNALYPTLIVSVISEGYGAFGTPWTVYLVKASITLTLAIPLFFGINIVGRGMAVLSIAVVLPFLVLCGCGLWSDHDGTNWAALMEVRRTDPTDPNSPIMINWSLLLNILFWNFNGFHGMSVFAGEVENPTRSYPKALAIVVLLVILTYFLPLAIGTAVNQPPWYTWNEGSFSEIAHIGGSFLTGWIVIASCCSNVGMYMTELFVDSFQLLGMAELGLAPELFARRHVTYDTPRNAIYASLVVILILSAFDFEDILIFDNALSCTGTVLSLFAAIKLRYSHSHVPRPFKIPGGTLTMVLLTVLPTSVACCIVYTTVQSIVAFLGIVAAVMLGIGLYVMIRRPPQF